jgi:ADP-ribose pyrophosphatase
VPSEDGEFRIVASRSLLDLGRGVRVESAIVKGPDGGRFERDVIRHPGAVAVVPVLADGRAVLVRQWRVAAEEAILEIPAGLRDVAGEPTEETARRELAEEAGYRATDELVLLTSCWTAVGLLDEVCHIYLATGLEPCASDRQGVEEQAITIELVALDDVSSMVTDGRLRDAKTILGLLLARERLA